MIRHILLIAFKQHTNRIEIQAVKDAFLDIPAKIPGIASVEWGLNNSPEDKNAGFTHSVLMTFEDEATRTGYLDHPEHVKLKTIFAPVLGELIVFDYLVDNSRL